MNTVKFPFKKVKKPIDALEDTDSLIEISKAVEYMDYISGRTIDYVLENIKKYNGYFRVTDIMSTILNKNARRPLISKIAGDIFLNDQYYISELWFKLLNNSNSVDKIRKKNEY